MKTKKRYIIVNQFCECTAREAMAAHRAGKIVNVHRPDGSVVTIQGAPQPAKVDDNREHCRRIAEDVEAYAAGDVFRCPHCGDTFIWPYGVGDKFKCPHCGTVDGDDEYEQLSLLDYFSDCLDIEYRVGSRTDYRSCKIMVACGGPNIYIDTADALVKLYWWTEYAEYPLSYDARTAVDDLFQEYWECM